MNILMNLAPHAAILIGNMYYVFWGIDRVNNSMNFIDNPYTKFLLLALIAFSGLNNWRLARITLAKLRRTDNPVPVYVRLGVIALNTLLAAIILVLLVIDLFNEDLLLFLSEFVKAMILVLCLTGLMNSLQLTARERARIREENRRRAQIRRQPPRPGMPQRRPAPQRPQPSRYDDFRPQPVRPAGDSRPRTPSSRYDDFYPQPVRSSGDSRQPARPGDSRPSPRQRPANRPVDRY